MTWHPPPRPDWVRAVNAGDVLPMAEEAELPLTIAGLLGEARARTSLEDFGDDAFLEPLSVLLPALEGEAELTLLGRWITRRFLLRVLEVRLQLTAYVAADPGVRDQEIVEPLFVTGAPRTGTTILHALLAVDPANRVPEGWELLRPVPPPDPVTFADDPRIALADRELRLPTVVVDGLDAIHVYGGRMPKECLSAMSFELRSEEFTARYHVPSYADWLFACDMRPAYEMHKLVLQVLQRRTGPTRWVLKSPVHLHSLPVLLDVYPDARIAVTHRDPLTVLASVSSLVATLRYAHSDRVDMTEIGRYHADLYHADLDRLAVEVAAGALPADRIHHTRYADFITDGVAVVRSVYSAAGRELDPETARRMAAHLSDRPKDHLGTHEYHFADLGLDLATETARFDRYRTHFGIPVEPPA
jgi:hypothetical protein